MLEYTLRAWWVGRRLPQIEPSFRPLKESVKDYVSYLETGARL